MIGFTIYVKNVGVEKIVLPYRDEQGAKRPLVILESAPMFLGSKCAGFQICKQLQKPDALESVYLHSLKSTGYKGEVRNFLVNMKQYEMCENRLFDINPNWSAGK